MVAFHHPAVSYNELYGGMLIQFKTKKRNADAEIEPTRRDESEWVRVERKDLRIVCDDLWKAAHARIQHAARHSISDDGSHSRRQCRRANVSIVAATASRNICWPVTCAAVVRRHAQRADPSAREAPGAREPSALVSDGRALLNECWRVR